MFFLLLFLACSSLDSTDTTAPASSGAEVVSCVDHKAEPAPTIRDGYPLAMDCDDSRCLPATWEKQYETGSVLISCQRSWVELRWIP
jgi:hypothetical protein